MKWWCWWWWRWCDTTVEVVMVMMIATNKAFTLQVLVLSKHSTDTNSIHPDSNSINRYIHYYYLHLLVWKLRYRKVSITCPRSHSRPWNQESSRVHPLHSSSHSGYWLMSKWRGSSSLGRQDPLEKEMTTHSSIPAWRIPWTEETGGLQSMGS